MPSEDLPLDDPEVIEAKLEEMKAGLKGKKPEDSLEDSSKKPPSEPEEEPDFEDFEEDDDYDKAMKQVEEGKKKTEEEPEEEEVKKEEIKEEPEAEKKLETEEKVDPKLAEQVKGEVLKIVGEDAVAKIKGREIKVKDFTPEETMFYLQKGFRADELMREASEVKKTAESQLSSLSQKADLAGQVISRRGEQPLEKPSGEATVPKELEEEEFDDAQTKALKAVGRGLCEKVDNLEKQGQVQLSKQAEDALYRDISSHEEDYPLASKEEAFIVKALNPNVPTRELMAESDKNYGSKDFIEKIFKHRPDIKRHFFDKHVNDYLAKKPGAKKVPEKPTGSQKVESVKSKVKFDKNYSFEQAEALAKAKIAQKTKEASEEELF